MHTLVTDLRHILRGLLHAPAFTLTVLLTLALGCGLNAAVFAVVDSVIVKPLGYHDADRIVGLQSHLVQQNRSFPRLAGPDYNDVERDVHGLSAVASYASYTDAVGLNGSALYLPVAVVTPRFGAVLGVEPIAGRLFHVDDGNAQDALISAAFARAHFPSASAALGQALRNHSALYTVVGVLPDGFSFPGKTEVWLEQKDDFSTDSRTSYNQNAIGRRGAAVTSAQLNAQLTAFSAQLQRTFPEDQNKTIEAISVQEQIVGKIRPTLNLLLASTLVLLLVVCANLTHLQLVRAARQMREASIRTALGASRARLARQALLEALTLSVAGSFAAFLVAMPALRLLIAFAPPDLPACKRSISTRVSSSTPSQPRWPSWS